MQRERICVCIDARIKLANHRIVSRNDAIGMTSKALDGRPAFSHIADVVNDGKRIAPVDVAIIMRGVRRQHHRSARGLNANHLQAIRVSADVMQRHARRDLVVAVMENDTLTEYMTDH